MRGNIDPCDTVVMSIRLPKRVKNELQAYRSATGLSWDKFIIYLYNREIGRIDPIPKATIKDGLVYWLKLIGD